MATPPGAVIFRFYGEQSPLYWRLVFDAREAEAPMDSVRWRMFRSPILFIARPEIRIETGFRINNGDRTAVSIGMAFIHSSPPAYLQALVTASGNTEKLQGLFTELSVNVSRILPRCAIACLGMPAGTSVV